MARLAVILVRGFGHTPGMIVDTLRMLNLHRKNHCVVIEDTLSNRGMVRKVKDYVTWGEISGEVFKELLAKRGKEYKDRLTDSKKKYHYGSLQADSKHYRKYFALNPPRKGFERKGIKVHFAAGGALGYRKDKINDLLKRMI